MTRLDYFLGKLGVIAVLVALVAVLPAVVAYVLGVCFSLDLSVVRDTWSLLPASILYGLVIVVSAGACWPCRRCRGGRCTSALAWVGIWLITSSVSGVLEGIHMNTVRMETWRQQHEAETVEAPPRRPGYRGRRGMSPRFDDESVQAALAKAGKTNWRRLFSYTANLQRLGEAALNTDAAWVKIGRVLGSSQSQAAMMFEASSGQWSGAEPQPLNERSMADEKVPQYPWTWSAAVLAGLLGISLWIVSMRVRSLDRLR